MMTWKGQRSQDALDMDQVGAAQVVKPTLSEDLGSSLELHLPPFLQGLLGVMQSSAPSMARHHWR